MHICTIVARNYLSQARVLANSFLEHHPDGGVTVLVIDDVFLDVGQDAEPFEVLRVADLMWDQVEFHRMAVLYDVVEFSTALKPWLLQTLLDRGLPAVTYLDPDIQVFAPLDEIDELARHHDMVVTPHATSPMPRDGKMPSETSILASGIYNLGFIAVGQTARPFLHQWQERLVRDCVVDPLSMRFVDQRWIDFAPTIFDAAIVRDPTYNVAYWNLDHRDLQWTGDRFVVDGSPLHFFHFSGYNPDARHLLSKYQTGQPRVLLSERPAVQRVCDGYGDLLEAEGHAVMAKAEYGLARAVNGLPIDACVRRLYGEEIDRADAGLVAYPPDPFDAKGAEAFVRWLNAMADVSAGPARLTRYLATVFATRPELHALFPDPQGADYQRFIEWAFDEMVEGRIDPRLVLPSRSAGERDQSVDRGPWAPPDRLRPGIVLYGYLRAELGVGEWARLSLQAVEAADVPYTTVVNTTPTSRQQYPFVGRGAHTYDFDINLLCVNADQVPVVRDQLGPAFFAGRHTIGQWAWELEEFPDRWQSSFDLVDEVWAISEFTRSAISAKSDMPVFVFPPAIVAPTVPMGVDRSTLGVPEGRFAFLFTFDLLSIFERKNPLGLIEAYRRAFPDDQVDDEGPVLVLKVINGDQRILDLERLRSAAADRPDILLVDRYFDVKEQAALMATIDCYVSLHRSEGFGLTMAEAMALGKPVIATGYSGNLDFMSDENAYLVSGIPSVVPAGCDPYPEGAAWVDPDIGDAARLMRHVVDHPDEAAETGRRAREYVLTEHGVARRAQFVRDRFQAIQEARAETVRAAMAAGIADASPTAAEPLEPTLVALARSRPSLETAARRMPQVGRFYRRVILRVQRHHDDHQRQINVALAEGVERQGQEAQESLARVEAQLGSVLDWSSRTLGEHAQLLEAQAERQATMRQQTETMRRQIEKLHLDVEYLRALTVDLGRDVREVQIEAEALHAVPYMSDPKALLTTDADGRPAIGYRGVDREVAGRYADFEDIFRGPEDFIRERQRLYLPFLADQDPVLDIGCGRGEVLDVLAKAGVKAVGVDLDDSMVERCRVKGHTVEKADAVQYLAGLADDSLGAVFSAQVIEHLTPEDLAALLVQSHRALRADGLFIAETVNPHSVPAFKTFWTDLTHKAPIFPEVAVAMVQAAGFEECIVLFPNGTGELEDDRRSQGEYAVVARK